jgi:hypothetical protein
VVNEDTGGPVDSVRVSLLDGQGLPGGGRSAAIPYANDTATSGGDGTFTLPLNLPTGWRSVYFKLTAPPGYDDTYQGFKPATAADRPEIRMYPTLVIRPGESIEVRVDGRVNVLCGWDACACRRVLVAASSDDPVELEVVSNDSSKPMALGLAIPDDPWILGPDPGMSERRLMVPPGGVPYVISGSSSGTATLTARR